MDISRREFIKKSAFCACGCIVGLSLSREIMAKTRPSLSSSGLREAMFYEKMEGGIAHCLLCPCSPREEKCGYLKEGEMCVCNVRINRGGKIYITNYGKPCALHVDPIEKNPIYHMTPGKKNLALATAGCNLECKCCQNWQMSQKRVDEIKSFDMPPAEVVKKAKEYNCHGISYTYTEPVIFYEYMLDTAKLANQAGLKNCVVSGGYILPKPLKLLAEHVQGFSISVKGFTEDCYKKYYRGKLSTILDALKTIREAGAWLEIVALVIPTISDDLDQIGGFCDWVRDNLGTMVPVHFSRFVPEFELKNLPKTPVMTLEKAAKTAKAKGIKYVYIGNLPGHEGGNTYCHKCGKMIIQRIGMKMIKSNIVKGSCSFCGSVIPGFWS